MPTDWKDIPRVICPHFIRCCHTSCSYWKPMKRYPVATYIECWADKDSEKIYHFPDRPGEMIELVFIEE